MPSLSSPLQTNISHVKSHVNGSCCTYLMSLWGCISKSLMRVSRRLRPHMFPFTPKLVSFNPPPTLRLCLVTCHSPSLHNTTNETHIQMTMHSCNLMCNDVTSARNVKPSWQHMPTSDPRPHIWIVRIWDASCMPWYLQLKARSNTQPISPTPSPIWTAMHWTKVHGCEAMWCRV